MPTPLPDELLEALQHSSAQVLCHDIVMDAIDISLALDRHVLLYALQGLFLLETDEASWRLAPSRIAWVPAGTLVQTTTIKEVRCTSLFFQRDFAPPLATKPHVFEVSPVVREMINHSRGWAGKEPTDKPEHDRFFLTLLDLCRGQLQENAQLSLPKANSEDLVEVLRYTQANLSEPLKLEDVAKKAAMSPRTLMRRLNLEIHMTWGQYLYVARMLRAMECLAHGTQVTETAFDVGYTNVGAFSTAFRKFTQSTPTHYRGQF